MAVEAKYMFFYATMQLYYNATMQLRTNNAKIDVLGCKHILATPTKCWHIQQKKLC